MKLDAEVLRDCVREVWRHGPTEKRWKERHALAVSFKEQQMSLDEATPELMEWNQRGKNPWPKHKIRKAIVEYSVWVYSRTTKLGCHALRRYGFCVKPTSRCRYEELDAGAANILRQSKFPEVRQFHELGWPQYLAKEYSNGSDAVQVYEVLIRAVVERNLTFGSTLFVSYRGIARTSAALWKFGMNPMAACRGMRVLQEEELVELVEQGSGKRRSLKANGYRIALPVPPIPVVVTHKALPIGY